MTIRKGEPWGDVAPLPPDGVVVRSDAEARDVLIAARLAKEPFPTLGLLDVTEGELPLRQRSEARRRARLGAHLPHPGLRMTRVPAAQFTFDRPTPMHLDGVSVGSGIDVSVRIEPDALTVVV